MRPNLQSARKAKGLTQQQMAKHLGVTVRTYQRIESGEVLGSIKYWDKLEDLFETNQRILRISSVNPSI